MFVAVSLLLENCGVIAPPCVRDGASAGNGDPKVKQDTFNPTPPHPRPLASSLLARVNGMDEFELDMGKCPKAP